MLKNKFNKLINLYSKLFREKNFDKYKIKGAYHWTLYSELIWYQLKVNFILSKIEHSEKNALDIGCGDGLLVFKMSERLKRAVGLDISPDGIESGQEKLNENKAINAEIYCSDLLEYVAKNKNDKFNYITCIDVIEHINDDKKFISEIASSNIFLEDTKIFIGTPLFIKRSLVSKYHYREYTLKQIRKLLSSKFDIVEEIFLDDLRKDGLVYKRNYYIAECKIE